MTTPHASLDALLAVQGHDLVIDQLQYRRETLPARQALRALQEGQGRLTADQDALGARLHELDRVQRRLEDEIESIEAKAVESESRLYGGIVQAPKELQALVSEVDALRGRKRASEDELLEVMESIEPLSAERQRMEHRDGELAVESEQRRRDLASEEAQIDGELAVEASARENLAAEVPGDLLAVYERLRRSLDGVGIARVDAGRCAGCHLSLSAVELDALRRLAEGQVVRHEECGRLLVP